MSAEPPVEVRPVPAADALRVRVGDRMVYLGGKHLPVPPGEHRGRYALRSLAKQFGQHLKRPVTDRQALQLIVDALGSADYLVEQVGKLELHQVGIPQDSPSGRALAGADRAWLFVVNRDWKFPILTTVRPRRHQETAQTWQPSRLLREQHRTRLVHDTRGRGTGFFYRNVGADHLVVTVAHVTPRRAVDGSLRAGGRRVLDVATVSWTELRAAYGGVAAEWFANRVLPSATRDCPDLRLLLVEGNVPLPDAVLAEELALQQELALFGVLDGRGIGAIVPIQELVAGSIGLPVETFSGWSGGPAINDRYQVSGVVVTGSTPDAEEVWTYLIGADLLRAFLRLAEPKLGVRPAPPPVGTLRRATAVLSQLLGRTTSAVCS